MPELPEVETIRSQLEKLIVGKKIVKIDVSLAKMVKLSLSESEETGEEIMRPPIFRGKVVKGKIELDNRDRFRVYLSTFEGKRIELVLRERNTGRSDEANRYYWGIVINMLSCQNDKLEKLLLHPQLWPE